MFKIYDGRTHFWQWDLDCKLVFEDSSITNVHFCNRTDSCSLVCDVYEENGQFLVDVPNILLQTDWDIHVYAYDKNYTKHEDYFKVRPRTKPSDYVYTETEIATWAKLEERMDEIEASVTAEGVANAVAEYLEQNPIEVGATAEEAAQIEANKVAIADINNALETEYVTKTELNKLDYQTADDVIDKIDYYCHDFAKKEDIPDISDCLTEIPEEYVTDSELNAKGYLTEHQSLEGYATESYVTTAIQNAMSSLVDGDEVSY